VAMLRGDSDSVARSGRGFGEGTASPFTPARGPKKHSKLSQLVSGKALLPKSFDVFSEHYCKSVMPDDV